MRRATSTSLETVIFVTLLAACGGDGAIGAETLDVGQDAGEVVDAIVPADAPPAVSDAPDANEALDAAEPEDPGLPAPAEVTAGDSSGEDAGSLDAEGAEVIDPPSAPLFDLPAISDPATADCTFTDHHTAFDGGTLLDVWRVSYLSWESIDGSLTPILIRGYAARPADALEAIPGVVQAHGLGGHAKESHATGLASLLGMFVIAYTGPGGGDSPENTSEGLPSGHDGGYRMFDTLPDPRGSWFWGHAVAGMRAVTCLADHPGVDPGRLGMTGYSAGGVATLMTAGVDPRVKAAVPLSGSGAWATATASPDAWQHALLAGAELTVDSPEWTTLTSTIDAEVLVEGAKTHVLMVNGTTDEFFPLTAHVATLDAIAPSVTTRTSLVGNFDHGCYAVTGVESAAKIEARAEIRAAGGQRLWFKHHFGTDATYAYLPSQPTLEVSAAGPATAVTVIADPGGPDLQIEHVWIWWSNDDAFIFGNVELKKGSGGTFADIALFPLQANTIVYADVQYTTGGLFPERFSLSSRPKIPAGLIPHIRGMDSCL